MSTTNLPLIPSNPNYRFGTSLDGVQYVIDIRWNARANLGGGAWYMDVLQADQTPIRMGLKVVLGCVLGGRVTAPEFPQGALFAVDQSGLDVEASLDDLGTRLIVVYVPAADL